MKNIGVEDAYQRMQSDPEAIYLDVRSVAEFEQGHPIRAINIPLLHFYPGAGMVPNEEFAEVVEKNLPKDAKLLVGCKSGGRSAKACEILSDLGYKDVTNVRQGYVGATNPMGQMVDPGWSLRNLPDCASCRAEDTYDSLAARK
jgi:rhodanese-related sulfurtransferase